MKKDELKKVLGARIREERMKKGWSIEFLAERLDMSPASLGLVERSDRLLSVPKLYLVSKTFGITIDSLLLENEQSHKHKASELFLHCRDLSNEDFLCVLDVVRTLTGYIKSKYDD